MTVLQFFIARNLDPETSKVFLEELGTLDASQSRNGDRSHDLWRDSVRVL